MFAALIASMMLAKEPDLAIEIPVDAKVEAYGWNTRPWRKTKTFRYGYFKWCDDPSCWLCGDLVYKPNVLIDERPTVEIKR